MGRSRQRITSVLIFIGRLKCQGTYSSRFGLKLIRDIDLFGQFPALEFIHIQALHLVDFSVRSESSVITQKQKRRIKCSSGKINPLLGKLYLRRQVIPGIDRKSTRLNSSHVKISYAVFCLKKK